MSFIVGSINELGIKSEEIRRFYSKHWNRKTAVSLDQFYNWLVMGSPSDNGIDHSIAAINDETNEIIAALIVTTRPFYLNEKKLDGAEPSSAIVNPDYQRQRLGIKLLDYLMKNYDVMLMMSMSEAGLGLLYKMGFRYLKAIPRFVKVYDWQTIEPYAYADQLAKKLYLYRSEGNENIAYMLEDVKRDKISELENITKKNLNFFTRNYNYIQWRYVNHPTFDYKHFIIKSKDKKGSGVYICLREENSVENLRIIHIMDFFGDQIDMPAGISFINSYCKENKFHIADFYCTTSSISKHFISSGWFSINDDICFQFPHLFHPLETRTPPTSSMMYWSKYNFSELCDTSKLYVTKQDNDLDRPTMTTYETAKKLANA